MTTVDTIGRVLMTAVEDQPWWKRYAATLTTEASLVVSLGMWVTATFTDLPPTVATIIGAVVVVAGVIAQRRTVNGLTPRTSRKTLDVLAPHLDDAVQQFNIQATSVDQAIKKAGRHLAKTADRRPSWQDYLK